MSLEASTDGKNWKQIAEFKEGAAEAKLIDGTKFVRIRVTKKQSSWLQVREFEFSK